MKQQIAAGILAVSMVGGVGTGVVANQLRSDDAQADADGRPRPPRPPRRQPRQDRRRRQRDDRGTGEARRCSPLNSLQILAGQVGPVKVGMSKSEAVATGYLDKDVASGCLRHGRPAGVEARVQGRTRHLHARRRRGLRDRHLEAGAATRSGLQVGSTYKSVKDCARSRSRSPSRLGYGQTGLFVNQGDSWIGFLFDAAPDDGDGLLEGHVHRGDPRPDARPDARRLLTVGSKVARGLPIGG